jgi:hypothetical protein
LILRSCTAKIGVSVRSDARARRRRSDLERVLERKVLVGGGDGARRRCFFEKGAELDFGLEEGILAELCGERAAECGVEAVCAEAACAGEDCPEELVEEDVHGAQGVRAQLCRADVGEDDIGRARGEVGRTRVEPGGGHWQHTLGRRGRRKRVEVVAAARRRLVANGARSSPMARATDRRMGPG